MNFTNSQYAEYPDDYGSPSSNAFYVDPGDEPPPSRGSLLRPLCKVCGDRSTGINYGVVSCSGCKKAFQRAVDNWSSKQETCKYKGYNCLIDIQNRTNCLACRLKKCLEAGMRRKDVHAMNSVLEYFRTVDPSFSMTDIVEENKENMEYEQEEFEQSARNPKEITLAELNGSDHAQQNDWDDEEQWEYGDGDNTLMANSEFPGDPSWDPDQSSLFDASAPSSSQAMSEYYYEDYYEEAHPVEYSQLLGNTVAGPAEDQSQTQTVQEYIQSMPGFPNKLNMKSARREDSVPVSNLPPEQMWFGPYWERPPEDFSYLSEHSYAKRGDDPYCTVCSAPATRSHLGVKACEDCTTRFAQYVLIARVRPTVCRTGQTECEDCEYCHFQKCVRAGMRGRAIKKRARSIESVHYPFCQVCGKRPTGVRFGVWSCDGCKFRFIRLTKNGQYPEVCKYKGVCPISSSTCLSCWYEKCIDVGMKREGMELQPIPAEWAEPEESREEAEDSANIILKFYETCAFTVVKMKKINIKNFNMLTVLYDAHIDRLNAWQMYSYEMAHDMQATGEFLRNVPRLDEIEMEERVSLLKNNYFAIYLLNISRGLSLRGMYLPDGRLITLNVLVLLFEESLLRQILNFVEKFNEFKCSDAEIALAIPLIFIRNDKATEKIWELRKYYAKLLSKNSSERIAKLFNELAPGLPRITRNFQNVLNFVRDNVQFLNLCPYFMEMFDIQFPSMTPLITPDANVPVVIDITCE